MPRKLKVFRTPIGFHDAYVATPTKKAALEAWGTDANLFARGTAEEVTDPKLTAAPLERPGEVIRVSRGGQPGVGDLLGRAAGEQVRIGAPRLERGLLARRGDIGVVETDRRAENLELARHGSRNRATEPWFPGSSPERMRRWTRD